jgi:uncharacterized protein YutE (UPF0331/DUF86 family)
VVDNAVVAAKVATVADATARIRGTLPPDVEAFARDRDVRDIVTLNLFVAIQACIDLATHWIADAGWLMPATYADTFRALADHGLIPHGLAMRLAEAAGFRNLVAHQYGEIDPNRVHAFAGGDLGDLEEFCAILARHVSGTA